MTRRTAYAFAALGLAAAAGCYNSPNGDLPNVRPSTSSTDGTTPSLGGGAEANNAEAGAAAAAASGIPCDVAKILATSCTGCHGTKLLNGAPNALVTYADLAATSRDDASQTVAAISLARMQATKKPMPPDGQLGEDDIAVFAAWVKDGLPKGSCGETPGPTPDGGDSSDGGTGTDDGGGGGGTTSVCTSGQTWSSSDPPSSLMHPGKTCLACHAQFGAPTYQLAGTVFPTLHEPDDCLGANKTGMNVLIIDAAGVSHTMPVNANGNFYRVTSIPLPYRATVVNGTKIREMKTPQMDGDCNGCHSESGNGSPGRIMTP